VTKPQKHATEPVVAVQVGKDSRTWFIAAEVDNFAGKQRFWRLCSHHHKKPEVAVACGERILGMVHGR
jgi:hypothetical protein